MPCELVAQRRYKLCVCEVRGCVQRMNLCLMIARISSSDRFCKDRQADRQRSDCEFVA